MQDNTGNRTYNKKNINQVATDYFAKIHGDTEKKSTKE